MSDRLTPLDLSRIEGEAQIAKARTYTQGGGLTEKRLAGLILDLVDEVSALMTEVALLKVNEPHPYQVPLLCSFALGRGEYCKEPHGHDPRHF